MKLRYIFLALTLFALCSFLSYGQEPLKLKVVVDEARVNETPEISANTLARLALDTIVDSEEKEGEWFKITLEQEGVKIIGYMHEMLVKVVTEEEIIAEEAVPGLPEIPQENIIQEIEIVMDENRERIRQDRDLEKAILSLSPLIAKAFRITDNTKQRKLATEIFLWMGLGYAGQDQHRKSLNAIRSMFEVEYNYAKEITRNIYDPKMMCLIQHAEREYLGRPSEYTIEISTNPEGANIKLNGKAVGLSPGIFQADSPIVQVVIDIGGHASIQDEVLITQEMPHKQYTLEPVGRNIVIKSKPAGAKVFFNGEDTGIMTKGTLPYVDFGEHHIKLLKENHQEWEETINLEKSADPYIIDVVLPVTKYQYLNKWGGPNARIFERPLAIALDNDNNVYVLDESRAKLKKFNPEGEVLTNWKLHGDRYKGMKTPSSVAVDSEGYIYVTDVKEHCVWKFDRQGKFINKWGKEGNDKAEFLRPSGIAVTDTFDVYVIDSGNYRIKIYSSLGKLKDIWVKPANVILPTALAFNANNDLYLLDKLKAYKFSSTGELILSWGKHGRNDGEFRSPKGIFIDSDNFIYIADTLNSRIQKHDAEGKFVTKWGIPGSEDGKFNAPTDIAVDNRGYVYVVDTDNNRVQIFSVSPPSEE